MPAAVYAGSAGALAYGALKLVWSFGSTAGIEDVPPWQDRSGWGRHADGLARIVAFEGTVVLSAVAVLVMLALVQRGGSASRNDRLSHWPEWEARPWERRGSRASC